MNRSYQTTPHRRPRITPNIKAQLVQAEVLATIKRRNRAIRVRVSLMTAKGMMVNVTI